LTLGETVIAAALLTAGAAVTFLTAGLFLTVIRPMSVAARVSTKS
jgi:hypothetical protein